MNILITGGAGAIGSSLALRLAEKKDNTITVIDNLLTGFVHNLELDSHPNISFVEGDVNVWTDIEPVMTSGHFDYVFHYAAVVGVQRTTDHPDWVLRDVDGFKHVFTLAADTSVKRIFFSSSAEVYGDPVEIPQDEEKTPLNARVPYAVVKHMGEIFAQTYMQVHGLDYTVFRFFNTYGPKQSPDFVVSKFIDAALTGKDIPVYGDGMQNRSFCYIDDNLDAVCRCLYEDAGRNMIMNIGNDANITIKELAEMIIRLTNSKSKVVHVSPLKVGDMPRRQPKVEHMKQLLKHEFTSLEVGLQHVIDARLKASM